MGKDSNLSEIKASAVYQVVEKPWRSMVKALSWRVTGTMDTMVVSFLITGQMETAIKIGFVEVFTKMILYYVHERAWLKISIGRKTVQESDYQI